MHVTFRLCMVFVCFSLLLSSCGSPESQPGELRKFVGVGVVEDLGSIDFNGRVLRDSSTKAIFYLAGTPYESEQGGSIVEYEGTLVKEPTFGGEPTRIEFSKFTVIGINN